jgi:magnesium transporter
MKTDKLIAKGHVTFETAIEHICAHVPVAEPQQRAAEVREALAHQRFDSAAHVVICEGQHFRGIARIEDLLAADANVEMRAIMDAEAPFVGPGIDQEVAAWKAVRHGESALSVVDGDGRFIGVIPPHRLLAVLLSEHDEDLSRLGGLMRGTSVARRTSEEPVTRRFWHRLPWLLVGLVGALLAADLVGWFDQQLEQTVMLAFFIPGIVYLADAVGTQTETVVVRGMSVGVPLQRMFQRELMAGLVIAAAIAIVAAPIVWWRWGQVDVAVTVGIALFAACSTATLTAMALPWLFERLRLDPAFGSGPLATVIQDLLSIMIYFVIATTIVTP